MVEKSGHEKVLVLVKALPQVGEKYGETVCCAGLTQDKQWRRLYPIRFRQIDTQFKRWQWIEYDWRKPSDDTRWESRRVQEDSISLTTSIPTKERAAFLSGALVPSFQHAEDKGNSLALIRPQNPHFYWKEKDATQIEEERRSYEWAASQHSLFDKELKALTPCKYEFRFSFSDAHGPHDHSCQDWETTAMFYRFRREYTEQKALDIMTTTFNDDYPSKGMAFAMGTSSRWPIWLLIGVIRLDELSQLGFDL